MGSGVVFVIIIGLWAVVLVPMWIRNHDASVESKSVDRFSTAMRTLSRRGSGPTAAGSREMLVPGGRRTVEVSGGRAPSAAARRAAATRAARIRRRRTTMFALLGFLLVMALAAVVGAIPLWVPGLVVVATGAFVWNLRRQAVREARLARRRRRLEARGARAEDALDYLEPAPVWPVTAARAAAPVRREAAYADPAFADTAFADTAVVEVDNGWAPTPVVLPTYVTAPPATSVPRVIDLTHPGSWSAAHMLDAVAAAGAPDPDEIFDGRAEPVAASPAARHDADGVEIFDQYEQPSHEHRSYAADHESVAATVAGSTARPFLDDDVVFDQDDDELLALLERRATGT